MSGLPGAKLKFLQEIFKQGGSYLISEENYIRYILGRERIGRADGQFMIPSYQMDALMKQFPHDPRAWEKALGLREGSLGSNPFRVDLTDPISHGLRVAPMDISGSNEYQRTDGMTPGIYSEGVTDSFWNPETYGESGSISHTGPQLLLDDGEDATRLMLGAAEAEAEEEEEERVVEVHTEVKVETEVEEETRVSVGPTDENGVAEMNVETETHTSTTVTTQTTAEIQKGPSNDNGMEL